MNAGSRERKVSLDIDILLSKNVGAKWEKNYIVERECMGVQTSGLHHL